MTSYWAGGILNGGLGVLNLVRSAVVENAGIVSGGIRNAGVLSATNSTVSDNWGTGILNEGGTLWLHSSTVCSNTGGNGFGIVNSDATPTSGLSYLADSIAAGNSYADLAGPAGSFISFDYNLIQNTNAASIAGVTTHNIYGQDPKLGPLADHGGPTMTHALLPGSPAIDNGSSGGLTTDQRGKPRPSNFATHPDAKDGSDIGAYELQGRSVTTLDDNGPGSLRQAIADAAPGDTIDFAVTGTITLTSGELVITDDLTVMGPGVTNVTVSGNNASRVFNITSPSATAAISALTIANGNGGVGDGGGILNLGNLNLGNCRVVNCTNSGVLLNGWSAKLTVLNSTFSGNYRQQGGAISCQPGGQLIAINSTFTSNSADAGGAIELQQPSTAAFTNCTVSGNSARVAGGIMNLGGSLIVSSSTVASNSAVAIGGINTYFGPPGNITSSTILFSSIVAGNSAASSPDCDGIVNSQDYNLIGNTNGCTITNLTAHNIYNQDPFLSPLANNGGPTPTHALLPGSPAIDRGSSGGLTTDQRGQPRPIDFPTIANAGGGDGSDIGAYEVRDLPQTGLIITVNSTDDTDDAVPGVLHCSLREAIHAANANTNAYSIINFAAMGTITLTSGELVVAKNLTISGPGATNLTVSGNNASRVLSFNNVSAVVTALTIANGRISTGNGAGINNLGGSLVLSNCVVTGNSADDWCLGIGIANSGSLTIFNSTISNNHGNRGDGGAIYNGPGGGASLRNINSTICQNYGSETGGLYNNYGHCAITNSTISGNSAYWHSGVHTRGPGTFWLCHSTVTGNAAMATWGRAVFVTAGGSLNIFNSIVAGNEVGTSSIDIVVEPIGSILISHDFNLIGKIWGGARTGVTTHNIYGKDPLLGPLADNGGPTLTHALLPGSPAIDHGSSGGLTTDQRGLPRPFNFPAYYDADDGSDIGAYELQERAQSGPVFTVNSNDDVDDGVPGIAHCSLREAINAANAIPGTNTINFATAIPGLMNGVTGTIVLTNGQLSVAKNDALSIIGPGATNLTISGNYSNRILLARLPLLSVTGLTFADGYAPGPPNYTTSSGGAISSFNGAGAIDISRCMFRGNVAAAYGGAVFQYSGFLKIAESVFQNNVADGGGAIVCLSASVNGTCMFSNTANSGGALTVFAGEKAGLTNCTMTANTVFGSGGGIGCWQAGDFGGMVYVDSCTISSNNAATGGGISMQNFPIHIRNSIIAGNRASSDSSGPDIRAIITSDDFNLIQNTNACTITNLTAHNIYNQDPKLGPLADLGGPTPTHALRYDSPAIDAGNSGGLTTDQRGLPRPIGAPSVAGGDGSDIGAYEADPNLRIMAIERLGQDIRLRFNNLFGRTYEVERTDTLVPPVIWTPVLGAEVVAGDGGIVTIIDPAGAGAPQRFYRVQLEAAPGA
ncbi:MAG: CSLREA domain-containing protein, partial [Verrucomicrobia bacterium]|nr:CSLREA domain-containing protein [Verrucomicrobiota bacterium]